MCSPTPHDYGASEVSVLALALLVVVLQNGAEPAASQHSVPDLATVVVGVTPSFPGDRHQPVLNLLGRKLISDCDTDTPHTATRSSGSKYFASDGTSLAYPAE